MWSDALLLAPYAAIASGIVLGIAVGVMCWSRDCRSILRNWWSAWWSALVGARKPGVVVHDPDVSKPHDLDDPFFDKDVRDRVGVTIAEATRRK